MLISVIIPAYNSEKYLHKAIKSVLEQTYHDIEVIIVDDGSTDNTKNIVKSFDDNRIKYIYQENSGVAKARNVGIEISNGEYIAFLDSDDSWEPEKLTIQLDKIKTDDDICMIYSAINIFFETKDKYMTLKYKELKKNEFIKSLLTDPFKTIPYPSTVLIRKSYLDQAGYFNPELPTGEDWDLWLRLAALGKCCYVDNILVKKITHNAGITYSMNLEETGICHFKILKNFFLKNPEYKFLKPKAHAIVNYDLACRYLSRNNGLPTKELYLNLFKSFFSYPALYLAKPKLKFVFDVLVKPKFIR